MRVAITASGGGHTGYAVAIAQRLRGKVDMVFIVPEGDEWSASKVEKFGEVVFVKKARGPKDPLWKCVPLFLKALYQSLRKVRDVDVLIATGSNHCMPPAITAKLKRIKLIAIESSVRFIRPSQSIKLLEPISDVIALQWPEQKKILPKGVVVGPLYELPEYKPWNGDYVLVTGGTYGHKLLFDAVSELELENVVLQTGRVDPEPYMKRHPEWTVFQFDPDFGKWLAGACVVVSHLGKTVIDAALTYHKPVVIVPNPEWRLTAGWEDARVLAKKLNAVLVEEITPKSLLEAIEEAKKLRPPTYPDGAEKLAREIVELG